MRVDATRRQFPVMPMSSTGPTSEGLPVDLLEELHLHLEQPFPESVRNRSQYGEVDAVTIAANIYCWAIRATSMSELDHSLLAEAADHLARSIDDFPDDAQPYYQRLLRIARLTLEV